MGSSRLERTCYWATRPVFTTKQQRQAPRDSKSFPVSYSTLFPSEQPATCNMQKLLVLDVIFASRLRALSAIAGCCFSRAANIGVSLEGIARISGILPTRLVLREMRPVLDYVRREGRVDEYCFVLYRLKIETRRGQFALSSTGPQQKNRCSLCKKLMVRQERMALSPQQL